MVLSCHPWRLYFFAVYKDDSSGLLKISDSISIIQHLCTVYFCDLLNKKKKKNTKIHLHTYIQHVPMILNCSNSMRTCTSEQDPHFHIHICLFFLTSVNGSLGLTPIWDWKRMSKAPQTTRQFPARLQIGSNSYEAVW